jgi:TATA-binding related factor (TRF) of subunit 20 of Mediator complex
VPKHLVQYRALRPATPDQSLQNHSIHQVSLPHHVTEPNSQFWIYDSGDSLSVLEIGSSFVEILGRIDSGWQEKQGMNITLEGRGFEWGRDWRIWCANLKMGTRYHGVVVEVKTLKLEIFKSAD